MNDGFFDVKLLFATPYEVNAIFGRPMIAPTTPHKNGDQ